MTLSQLPAAYIVYGIVTTIPLIFGAVHPIVQGSYLFIMLACLGTWLLLNCRSKYLQFDFFWHAVPVALVFYLIFQAIPLPLDWLDILSPSRAERVRMVNQLAGLEQQHFSLNENGPVGLWNSLFLLGTVFYYYSVKSLIEKKENFQEILLLCLIAVGTFEALYGLIQFINPHIGILWLPNPERAAHGTIIYKNQYASVLNMIWPLALASGLLHYLAKKNRGTTEETKKRLKQLAEELSAMKFQTPLMIFAVIIISLAILFSLSRGGIMSMVLIALLLLFLMPFSKREKIGCFLVLACLLGAYGSLLGLDLIVSRFNTLDNSGSHRLDIYLSSLPMLRDHWFSGIGFGSYSLLSPLYLKGFSSTILYDRVHNEYLEVLIELGVPMAVLLFLWIAAGMVKLLKDLLKSQKDLESDIRQRVIGIAAFCGLCGFLAHGVVDFGWRLPVALVYCATLLALCVCSVQQNTRPEALH